MENDVGVMALPVVTEDEKTVKRVKETRDIENETDEDNEDN